MQANDCTRLPWWCPKHRILLYASEKLPSSGRFSVDEPAATIRGINRPIPDNYKRHHADKADICDGVRALTTRERGYIQTFPDTFDFPGAKTDVELAIGNAVPPALAKYVANCIKQYCTE